MKTVTNNLLLPAASSDRLPDRTSAGSLLNILLALGLLLWTGNQARGHEDPVGCAPPTGAGNTSSGGVNPVCNIAHVGDTIEWTASLGMVANACRATAATGTIYFPDGTSTNFLINVTLDPGVLITCPGNPLCRPGPYSYTVRAEDVGDPAVSPLCTFGGVPKIIQAVENGEGITHQNDIDGSVRLRDCHNNTVFIVTPCIDVTKECVYPQGQNCFSFGQDIAFRGTVRNCGDIALTNVTAVDSIVGPLTLTDSNGIPLTLPVRLDAGATAFFNGSHPASGNLCGPFTNSVIARGVDISSCGGPRSVVTDAVTSICAVCTSPGIIVTKACPLTNAVPGSLLVFSGSVSNTGNVPLTNVIILNDRPVANTVVATFPSLGVGESRTFSGSYPVAADVCSVTDTLTARATNICNGVGVSDTDTATCPIDVSPSLRVTKACPVAPVQPGGTINWTGTVTNTGNVTLTNVIVRNDKPAPNTVVFGPTDLAPGAGASFGGNYTVPADSCGPYPDTLVGTGFDKCLGRGVTNSITVMCPGTNSPSIRVTKLCPIAPVQPGGTINWTGTVTNTGNITLTNVIVRNDKPAPNTVVFGPTDLAPGAGASFGGNYTVPADSCGPYPDTLVATGADKCFGRGVTDTITVECPGTNNPAIDVTKECLDAVVVAPGLARYRIRVQNTGNISLQNVRLVDDSFTPGVPGDDVIINVPGTLAPGAFFPATGFITNSVATTPEQCAGSGLITNTVVATGTNICVPLRGVTDTAFCSVRVICPAIVVYKQVVCYSNGVCEPFNADLTTQKSASGVRIEPANAANCPAFCYRITVRNTGTAPLNLTVTDNSTPDPDLNLSGCGFPAVLAPGATAQCVIPAVTHCQNTLNVVTATGTTDSGQTVSAQDTNNVTVQPIAITCVMDVSTNGGASFFVTDGNCPRVSLGNSYIVRLRITNAGQLPLQNVTITTTGAALCFASPLNIGNLPVGQTYSTQCTFTCTAQITNRYSVDVVGEAAGCDFNAQGQEIRTRTSCEACVRCEGIPKICVTKEVACLLPNDTCGPFGKEATGVKGDTQDPAFCYRITVLNCGQEKLVNVTVNDNKLGDLTTNFFGVGVTAGMLNIGESITRFFKMDWDRDMTNTVEAVGVGDSSRIRTNALDLAVARVRQARIMCISQILVDGVLIECGDSISDQNVHAVTFRTIVCNNGQAGLANVTITDTVLTNLGCTFTPFSLAVNQCVTNDCTINYSCADFPDGIQYTTTVTAEVDTNQFCAFDIDANRIEVTTTCGCSIACARPAACRVTGGGRQDNPLVCPDEGVRYVTHGGQVGAPVGNRTCGIDTTLPDWQLGNPCIHGRWTHVRHMKGGLRGNFHARFYDTLDCFCLDDTFLDGCQYNPGTVSEGKKHSLCNAGDRSLGPEPRKAPANKIAFTGVGDWQCESGRRAPRACLFRVDIEDRGEPGNAHALDSNGKPNRIPDRYRIRIWVLTPAEVARLNNPADGLLEFRNNISACYGIDYRDGGIRGPGGLCDENSCFGDRCTGAQDAGTPTITFPAGADLPPPSPVRAPNIDDGGELLHGNHQIHPSIKDCDPANPTGPGLANPHKP